MFGVATFLGEEELFEGLVIVLVSYDGLEEFFVDHEWGIALLEGDDAVTGFDFLDKHYWFPEYFHVKRE